MRGLHLSLRRRVTLTGTVVVAVLVLALDVFVYISLRDQLLADLERVLDAREQLVVGLRDELDPEELSEHLDDVGVRAVVQLRDGRSFRSAGAPHFGMLPPAEPDEPLASRTVPLGDGARATVLASRGGIEETLDQLLLIAIIGSTAVIALAYAVFARLSARMLRPVRDVATTARDIAEGRHDQRLNAREDDDELRDMVNAFNDMLDALEDALERSQEAETLSRRFLADAAHQLRTPAAGIRASVGTMLRTEEGAQREQMLDNLASESARMSRLLSSLLRVARLDSREEPARTATPIGPLLEEAVEHLRVRAPSLRFELDVDPHLVASVDTDSVSEAVGNLLDNAARHAEKVVRVDAASDARELRIRVHDDGPGVSPELRERIFDRFVSLGDGTGSGLGLPIARGIAEAHDGSLVYEDGAFVLRIPHVDRSLRVG